MAAWKALGKNCTLVSYTTPYVDAFPKLKFWKWLSIYFPLIPMVIIPI
jgi:hypothetical protein